MSNSFKPKVGEVAGVVAAQALGSLAPDDWRRLADLGTRHATGSLSREGWECATFATIEPALLRAERDVIRQLRWKE